jgi:hypothetical protein
MHRAYSSPVTFTQLFLASTPYLRLPRFSLYVSSVQPNLHIPTYPQPNKNQLPHLAVPPPRHTPAQLTHKTDVKKKKGARVHTNVIGILYFTNLSYAVTPQNYASPIVHARSVAIPQPALVNARLSSSRRRVMFHYRVFGAWDKKVGDKKKGSEVSLARSLERKGRKIHGLGGE